ncbi:thioredoxin family protein [bacterium]|nr:thioredoxin family protein [bacterium]
MIIGAGLLFSACGRQDKADPHGSGYLQSDNARITFVELGSVNCIPCKQMQPVMKSIETRYAGQVNVVFHDVWKDNTPAKKYGIKLIPTQIFLNHEGKELLRHEGFFAEAGIDSFLQAQGLQPLK